MLRFAHLYEFTFCEPQVPETPAINDEELPPLESPAIAAASKGKGRGRQGKGKKAQHLVAELEACFNITCM